MRKVVFENQALEDFIAWASENKQNFKKIGELLKEIQRTPFLGKGKPEPLKHELKGCWSRRITDEHRLVYEVTNDLIVIISCKYHY
jgi:toxin YoeB|nr:Txe/YoeB family addiction module toxin [uncultured Emticicia sp.]